MSPLSGSGKRSSRRRHRRPQRGGRGPLNPNWSRSLRRRARMAGRSRATEVLRQAAPGQARTAAVTPCSAAPHRPVRRRAAAAGGTMDSAPRRRTLRTHSDPYPDWCPGRAPAGRPPLQGSFKKQKRVCSGQAGRTDERRDAHDKRPAAQAADPTRPEPGAEGKTRRPGERRRRVQARIRGDAPPGSHFCGGDSPRRAANAAKDGGCGKPGRWMRSTMLGMGVPR